MRPRLHVTDDILRRVLAGRAVPLLSVTVVDLPKPGQLFDVDLVVRNVVGTQARVQVASAKLDPDGKSGSVSLRVVAIKQPGTPPPASVAPAGRAATPEPVAVHSGRSPPPAATVTPGATKPATAPTPTATPAPTLARKPTPAPVPLARRKVMRVDVEIGVDFKSEHNFYTGLTQNISEGGLFIASDNMRRVGEHIRIRFTLPDDPLAIEADARVVWTREHSTLFRRDGAHGYGIKFIDLAPAAAESIQAFIKRREPIFFDLA